MKNVVDKIVELVENEAKIRETKSSSCDIVSAMYSVMMDVDLKIAEVMSRIREEERYDDKDKITKEGEDRIRNI